MIILLDNYDSFTYNLAQYLGQLGETVKVLRNDAVSVAQIEAMHPDRLVLSPGPGRPENAGILLDVIRTLGPKIPTLGVCLGHQGIAMAFGGKVVPAVRLMHGKDDDMFYTDSALFKDVPQGFKAGRYHSLAVDVSGVKDLKVTATSHDGTVMAIEHVHYPIWGVQFHPESMLTPEGLHILQNFLTYTQPLSKEGSKESEENQPAMSQKGCS
ncbi:MAG: aminodeoxychorismate/anthranilate synthase component II [Firmicutes bacterium]|nr:aminodeoxychorismate/anthranilate synthase component II [Bacillota bacterium]